jgi:flagellar hook assembly protein FlgD
MPAGASVVLWNARNQDGNVVPAGMYLVKLTARSDDGQQASAVVAVNVRR